MRSVIERPRFPDQAADDVPEVDAASPSFALLPPNPVAVHHLIAAHVAAQTIIPEADLQHLSEKPGRNAVQHLPDIDGATAAHPDRQLFVVRTPPLRKARHENRLERQLQQLSYARVLILDEIGYLPMNREEASLFFRLLNRR